MYSYGPLHLAEQKQGDQFEPTYSPEDLLDAINDRERWGREWGISALMARQDDDNDYYYYYIYTHTHIYIHIYNKVYYIYIYIYIQKTWLYIYVCVCARARVCVYTRIIK